MSVLRKWFDATVVDLRLTFKVVLHDILLQPAQFTQFALLFCAGIIVLQWIFSPDTLLYILRGDNGLSTSQRIGVVLDAFVNVFRFWAHIIPVSLIAISAFQSWAALLRLRNRQGHRVKSNKKFRAGSLGAALLGLGCAACGGSIISATLINALASTATVALAQSFGYVLLLVGVALSYVSLSGVAFQRATLKYGGV